MRTTNYAAKALLLGMLPAASLVNAHTWIEQLTVIAPNGTMIGQPGFPRGNLQRTSPQFRDTAMVNLIPPNGGPPNKIDTNQFMCRPEQRSQSQPSSDNPRLKAAPGQAVALRYQENGHVTLPASSPGKPAGGGANFVYLTTNSKTDDKFLQIHRQWTPDGKGGDARGRLISTQNFDDGQCYQINDKQISKQRQAEFKHTADKYQGMELWCQQDIQIPQDAQPGTTVTLYWVWDWPTLPGTAGFPEGKQEIYTTCMDIDIVASAPGLSKAIAPGFVKQDLSNAAVSAQFADIANPTAIRAQTIPFSGANAATIIPTSTFPSVSSPATNKNTVVPTQVNTNSAASSPTTKASSTPTTAKSVGTTAVAPTVPNQVTITVKETVTATVTPTRSINPALSSSKGVAPAIETQTNIVTVTVTRPGPTKFQTMTVPAQTFVPIAVPLGSVSPAIADTNPDPNSDDSDINISNGPSTTTRCSTTARPFLLRARNPFYILSSQVRPDTPSTTVSAGTFPTTIKNTSAGTGC